MYVLFIIPPYNIAASWGSKRKMKTGSLPPLGVGYLAAALEGHGHRVKLLDAPSLGLEKEDILHRIGVESPDIIGISCLTTYGDAAYALAEVIKKNYPAILTAIGGPHVSAKYETILEVCPFLDAAFPGEAENSFTAYVDRIADKKPFDDIPGIVHRDKTGKTEFTGHAPLVKDLDMIAPPARHIYDKQLYRSLPNQGRRWPAATFFTSRGCPWSRCMFCYQRTEYGHKYRRRSPEACVAEIRDLVVNHGYREIMFWDDNFCINEGWINHFCDLLDAEKINIPWTVEGHIRTIRPAMLERMAKSGCYNIFLGIESGNQKILDMIEKGYTVEQCWEVMKWIKEIGLESRAAFLLGFPTETPQMARETIDFACNLDPDYANFVPFQVWPGSAIEKFALENGVSSPWNGYLVTPSYVPHTFENAAQIEALVKEAYRRFYLRPRVFWRTFKGLRHAHGWRRAYEGVKYLGSQ